MCNLVQFGQAKCSIFIHFEITGNTALGSSGGEASVLWLHGSAD